MFHAGLVTPSWSFRLQLLTLGDPTRSLVGLFAGLHLPEPESPVFAGAKPGRLPWPDDVCETLDSALVLLGETVSCGDNTPVRALAPIAEGNAEGFSLWAARENAPRHWRTCAGSFCSYRSTVKNISWSGRFRGGDWQARRKCEMFSICTNGMADFLNLTPGGPTAKLTSL